MDKYLIFKRSKEGTKGISINRNNYYGKNVSEIIPEKYLRSKKAGLPNVGVQDTVRHFINLSNLNYHIDKNMYPLGSCTMKYNPKINERTANLNGFTAIHPLQSEDSVQGALEVMYELGEMLKEATGFDDITLQPVAGAHGEYTGIMLIRAYQEAKGNPRKYIIIPDSAHGTNPASSVMAGYQTIEIKSNENGLVDIEKLREIVNEDVAGMMITNPNTLGLFETNIKEIAEILHSKGALLYMDGANLNALLGIVKPGEIGADILHFNLHKTFSTPHGGGGPGGGAIAVKSHLSNFLPVPYIVKDGEKYKLMYDREKSIGKIHSFYGNFLVMVRAYTYLKMIGEEYLGEISKNAIINANYIKSRLEKYYNLKYKRHCMHEVVLDGTLQKNNYGVKTMDIAKRILDYGFHAPTIYFPLIVHEAIMIEPTETESKETIDKFCDVMIKISKEIEENTEMVKSAPHNTPLKRLNNVLAVKQLDINYMD
ncbi:MAG: aminotransferase class V-fold PLP-dependent enzyme [Proteobacteria bacterium]|nr:aminotransferase class V-fold PLP-dependent enzyme [Pseudomonadota bacterium]